MRSTTPHATLSCGLISHCSLKPRAGASLPSPLLRRGASSRSLPDTTLLRNSLSAKRSLECGALRRLTCTKSKAVQSTALQRARLTLAQIDFRFTQQGHLILRDDARRGPNPEGWGSERGSSPTTQIAQKNPTAGEPKACGVVLCTPRLRGRDFSKQDEAQEGGREHGHEMPCSRTSILLRPLKLHLPLSSYKIFNNKGESTICQLGNAL